MSLFSRSVIAYREPLAQFLAQIVDYPELRPLASPLEQRLASEPPDQDKISLSPDEGNLLKILVEGFAFCKIRNPGYKYSLWSSLTSSVPNFGLNPFRIPFFALNPHWVLRFPPSHQALLSRLVQEQTELAKLWNEVGRRWGLDELIFDYSELATTRELLDRNEKDLELLYADLNLSRILVISDRLRLIRQRLAGIAGPSAGIVGPESKPDILWLAQTDSYEAYERNLETNIAGPWKEYIQQSRKNILETARLIQRGIRGHADPAQRPVVMILGAGSCAEIPLEELVKDYFVILVDINEDLVDRSIQRLSHSSKDDTQYVQTEIRDITGGVTLHLAKEAQTILHQSTTPEEAKAAFIKVLANQTPSTFPDLTGPQPVDLLVSTLVSNEMVYSVFFRFGEEFEKKFGTKLTGADIDQAFQNFQVRMTTGHTKALAYCARTRGALVGYVSEMRMEHSDDPLNPRLLMRQPDGKSLHRLDLLFEGEEGIEVIPWRTGQWRWPVSPQWGISYAVESLVVAPHSLDGDIRHPLNLERVIQGLLIDPGFIKSLPDERWRMALAIHRDPELLEPNRQLVREQFVRVMEQHILEEVKDIIGNPIKLKNLIVTEVIKPIQGQLKAKKTRNERKEEEKGLEKRGAGDGEIDHQTWNPLENRPLILKAEAWVTQNGKGNPNPARRPVVMVAGAGRCMDIPLRELASDYRVILVDLDERALRWVLHTLDAHLLPYVTLQIEDMSGSIIQETDEGLRKIVNREWNAQKAEVELFKYLEQATKRICSVDLTGGERVDFLISSMLASVLSLRPFLNLKKEWTRRYNRAPFPVLLERSFEEFDKALLEAHAQALTDYILGSNGIVYFATEVREISSHQPKHSAGRKTPRDVFGNHLADYFTGKWGGQLTVHDRWQRKWPLSTQQTTLEVQGIVLGSNAKGGIGEKVAPGAEAHKAAIDLEEVDSHSAKPAGNQPESSSQTGFKTAHAVRLYQPRVRINPLSRVAKL